MADVRAVAAYGESLDGLYTFTKDSSIVYDPSFYDLGNHSTQVGMAAALVADGQVGLGASGGYFLGKITRVESDGFVTVATRGVMGVPYVALNANPPLPGRGIQVDGAGNAITPAGGVRLATERGIVLHLDSTNQICYVQIGA